MRDKMKEAEEGGNRNFSHFGPGSNLFGELEELFRSYSLSGRGSSRTYVHDAEEGAKYGSEPGTFTPWTEIGEGSDLLFYEGLHGAVKTDEHDVAKYVDLLVGVAPSINLEWIQKLHRDRSRRGYSTEAVVDTSNPFIAKDIPTADESFLIIRFANPKGIDFPYLLSMIHDSFMSRPNTLVVPGGKLPLAMQIILTPLILRMIDTKKRAY
jgi:phosphoribulokinase